MSTRSAALPLVCLLASACTCREPARPEPARDAGPLVVPGLRTPEEWAAMEEVSVRSVVKLDCDASDGGTWTHAFVASPRARSLAYRYECTGGVLTVTLLDGGAPPPSPSVSQEQERRWALGHQWTQWQKACASSRELPSKELFGCRFTCSGGTPDLDSVTPKSCELAAMLGNGALEHPAH